jgi:hypothetical protein
MLTCSSCRRRSIYSTVPAVALLWFVSFSLIVAPEPAVAFQLYFRNGSYGPSKTTGAVAVK